MAPNIHIHGTTKLFIYVHALGNTPHDSSGFVLRYAIHITTIQHLTIGNVAMQIRMSPFEHSGICWNKAKVYDIAIYRRAWPLIKGWVQSMTTFPSRCWSQFCQPKSIYFCKDCFVKPLTFECSHIESCYSYVGLSVMIWPMLLGVSDRSLQGQIFLLLLLCSLFHQRIHNLPSRFFL